MKLSEFIQKFIVNMDYSNKVMHITGEQESYRVSGKDFRRFDHRIHKIKNSFDSFSDAATYCAWRYVCSQQQVIYYQGNLSTSEHEDVPE